MKNLVLILNLDFSPFDIWDWQHAISKYICTNSVNAIYDTEGIVKHDKIIKDGRGNEYELPAVLILNEYVRNINKNAKYTRFNIFARDKNQCLYCGIITKSDNRTIDHVIPKQKFNTKRYHFKLNSFLNTVTCCRNCNLKKRNRTPTQANMLLIRKPTNILQSQAYKNKILLTSKIPEQWNPYINNEKIHNK